MDKRQKSGSNNNICTMFNGLTRTKVSHTLVRPLFIRRFVYVVFVSVISIILLNTCTTTSLKVFNTLFDREDDNMIIAQDLIRVELNKQPTNFPSDILHDWKDNDNDTLAIYILSAIGFNTIVNQKYKSDIRLTGWVAKWLRNATIKCCILMNSGNVVQFKEHTVVHFEKNREDLNLTVHQYACQTTIRIEDILGATVQIHKSVCPKTSDRYIKPFIPQQVNIEESFAICLKIVFEQVDNLQLQNWLDYNRGMGVDKVFMFTYNITQETTDLLRHYIELGFVETRPFAYPWNNTRHIGDKDLQVWEDETSVVADCRQRLSRYKYIAVVDIDEFLVPRKHDDLKSMMKYLMKKYPKACGFKLHSYLFNKDIPPNPNISASLPVFMRYFQRTKALVGKFSRSKNIVLPKRTAVIGYTTHRFEAQPGFRRIVLDESEATTNHYRECYDDLNAICSNLTTDTYIRKFYHKLYNITEHRLIP